MRIHLAPVAIGALLLLGAGELSCAAVQLSDSIVTIITENIDTFTKKVMEKVPENLKEDIEHILSSELPNQIATDMADTIAEIGEEALEVS